MKKQNNSFRILLYGMLIVFSVLFALPNFFEKQPAVSIVPKTTGTIIPSDINLAIKTLEENKDKVGFREIEQKNGSAVVLFDSISKQMHGYEIINKKIGEDFYKNLNLVTNQPKLLDAIGAEPANLGLDLRGGVHFLMEVDVADIREQRIAKYKKHLRRKVEGRVSDKGDTLIIENTKQNKKIVYDDYSNVLNINENEKTLELTLIDQVIKDSVDSAIKQNIITLKNRVNEIGVAEPVVQRQGFERIVVQLPGIQDTQKAKEIIGATATLSFKAVVENPTGDMSEYEVIQGLDDGIAYVFEKDDIIAGESIVDSNSGFDPQSSRPLVSVQLDSEGGATMFEYTSKNQGKLMGSVLKTVLYETYMNENGVEEKRKIVTKNAINVARIQGTFSDRFQITGIDDKEEAHKLAILLRSGALASPIEIIEERTIGPNLGADNIAKGKLSILIGFVLVLILMVWRYRTLGLIANFCVLINMMALLSVLSVLGATLTLPGIAGIILTVGMAVDSNVVIFERIKEEYNKKGKVKKAIENGYDKAFSSIIDANITTFIAAVVLFAVGTGAVKGFAVTLLIGILTSLITSLYLSRFIVEMVYKNKKEIKL